MKTEQFLKALGGKMIVFLTDKANPQRSTKGAMLKSINGTELAKPLEIANAGKLSHLVPLVDMLDKRKKQRRRAKGKHPATDGAIQAAVARGASKATGAPKRPGKA